MSAKAVKKGDHQQGAAVAKSPFREVQRGTQNELEILGLIVATSPNIRQAVFDVIRKAKKRMEAREKKAPPVAE